MPNVLHTCTKDAPKNCIISESLNWRMIIQNKASLRIVHQIVILEIIVEYYCVNLLNGIISPFNAKH